MDDLDRKLYKLLSKENINNEITLLKAKLEETTDEVEKDKLKSYIKTWEEFLSYGK